MAASITIGSCAVAADGKTLTATISGGTGTGYSIGAIADSDLAPTGVTGQGFTFYVASASVLGTTLTVLLSNPIGAGETVRMNIASSATLTDSGGNTPTGQTNLTITNNSAVTVRVLDAYTDASAFEYNGKFRSLTGAGTAIRNEGRWVQDADDGLIEFVTDATDICMLGYSAAASIAFVDTGASVSLPHNGFWSAKPITTSPLAAGKHLVRIDHGDYFYGVRLAGGTRSTYTVPQTKRSILTSSVVAPQVPASSEVTAYGAYRLHPSDPQGEVYTADYGGLTLEAAFTGSGVEVSTVGGTAWSVSVDAARPGQLVAPTDYSGLYTMLPLAKGHGSGTHTIRAQLVGTQNSAIHLGVRVVNGTKTTASSIIGATTLSVASTTTLAVNDWVKIDDQASREWRQITAISGSGPYAITVAALAKAHGVGASVTSYSAPAGTISTYSRDDLSTARLLAVGDSNTQGANPLGFNGIPDANGDYYSFYDPRMFAGYKAVQGRNIEVVNLGLQGYTSANMVAKITDYPLYGRGLGFDRVTIWPGTNDINGTSTTPADYKENVRALILAAVPLLRPGGKIILMDVGTPATTNAGGLNITTANAQLAALADEYAASVIYAGDLLTDLVPADYDGVHYAVSGQDKIADALAPYLYSSGDGSLYLVLSPGVVTPIAFSTI